MLVLRVQVRGWCFVQDEKGRAKTSPQDLQPQKTPALDFPTSRD